MVRAKVGGVYEVALDDGTVVDARLRGRLKRNNRAGAGVVAGDRVEIHHAGGDAFVIGAVEPRRTALVRRAPGRGSRPKPVVANVDQVAVVLAAARPEPRPRMLDRLLVLAAAGGIPAFVVVNKVDLVDGTVPAAFRPYTAAGYDVLPTSVKSGAGLEQLHRRLCGRTSVLTGPSGVGKSSLLNAMEPGLDLRTGAVSEVPGRGRHTTVTARLIPLADGGCVVDTPGLREVGLWGVDAATLDRCFPEFTPHLGACRFGEQCTHTHEPGCAVRAAVAAGTIAGARHDSYCVLLEERG